MAQLLGIDLSPHVVRGALVRTQLRRVAVVRYLEVPIEPAPEPELTADGTPAAPPPSPVARAVAELVKLAGPGVETIAAMPTEDVSFRVLEFPAAAAKRLDELLPFEIEPLIPFDPAEAVLDHQPTRPAPGLLRVFAAASLRTKIEARLAELELAGVDPMELAPSAPALAGIAAFTPALATGAHMIVHVGAQRTEVVVMVDGRPELARAIPRGVVDLAHVAFAASPEAMASERLARELKQTLLAFRTAGGGELEAVWLSGEVLVNPPLVEWMSALFERPVRVLDLPVVEPGEPIDRTRFALALGLVGHTLGRARHIDFRKGAFVRKRRLGNARTLAPLIIGSILTVGSAYGYSVYARHSVLTSRRESLENQLAATSREVFGVETREVTRARALLVRGPESNDPLPAFTALDALVAVSNAIPPEIDTHDVQRLEIDLGQDQSEGHFEIQGTVATIGERDRISESLARIECFRELQNGQITAAGADRQQYRIEADIRCPGDERTDRRARSRSTGGAARQGGQ